MHHVPQLVASRHWRLVVVFCHVGDSTRRHGQPTCLQERLRFPTHRHGKSIQILKHRLQAALYMLTTDGGVLSSLAAESCRSARLVEQPDRLEHLGKVFQLLGRRRSGERNDMLINLLLQPLRRPERCALGEPPL